MALPINIGRQSACLLLLSSVLSAQVASIGMKTESAHLENSSLPAHKQRNQIAAIPMAGYYQSPGTTDVYSLITTSKNLRLGDALATPAGVKRLYLPPRQQYALAEQNASESLAVWSLHDQDLVALAGAMPHPDSVTFSSRGDAAVLYSQTLGRLQVITHLPVEPVISEAVSFAAFDKLAVSDDGAVVVAMLPSGRLVLGSGAPVETSFSPRALSFLPRTHNLVLIDSVQKMVVELSNVELSKAGGSSIAYRVIAQDIDADQLLATRGGEQIVAANLNSGQVWTIDPKSGAVSKQELGALNGVLSLRDGYTFLLSRPEGLSLLRLAEANH